ncbi:MAG: threonine synthase [Anaerolineae bacterium]
MALPFPPTPFLSQPFGFAQGKNWGRKGDERSEAGDGEGFASFEMDKARTSRSQRRSRLSKDRRLHVIFWGEKSGLQAEMHCLQRGISPQEIRYNCDCGGLLDVEHDLDSLREQVSRELFDSHLGDAVLPYASGVWRYRELVLPLDERAIVSRPEGNTNLYHSPRLNNWLGVDDLYLKHEGENPTGSFKDRGMTVGVTQAKFLGCQAVACASTGNTSASLAAYAALAELAAIVFVPQWQIAFGKLAQALAYGAKTLQVIGDFDAAMKLVCQACDELGIYLLNSLNPFRLEGQKSTVFEALQQLGWEVPDWIVLPAGNLGNTSAFGKALYELKELGLIGRMPRLAAVQAQGANPFYRSFLGGFQRRERVEARTIATAIRIGDPVSYPRAVRALRWTNGLVAEATDQEIMDAKARVDVAGIGCEPASADAVARARKLTQAGVIRRDHRVVVVLTGYLLKDPEATIAYHRGELEGIAPAYANRPLTVEPTLAAVREALAKQEPEAGSHRTERTKPCGLF